MLILFLGCSDDLANHRGRIGLELLLASATTETNRFFFVSGHTASLDISTTHGARRIDRNGVPNNFGDQSGRIGLEFLKTFAAAECDFLALVFHGTFRLDGLAADGALGIDRAICTVSEGDTDPEK